MDSLCPMWHDKHGNMRECNPYCQWWMSPQVEGDTGACAVTAMPIQVFNAGDSISYALVSDAVLDSVVDHD